MPWRKQTLEKVFKERLKGRDFIVASSTEPYTHEYAGGKVKAVRAPGGVVAALEPILKLNRGLWIAHGRGAADKDAVDASDKVKLPPTQPRYTLKRIWVSKKNLLGWYYGFANQALWPLCHNVFERPLFSKDHWDAYREVNKQFADAIVAEAGDRSPIVWIQDYQLALVGGMVRERRPDLVTGHFWHIPWPTADTFKVCPWDKEVIEGLLGNHLIGFHRISYCKNFLQSVAKTLEAKVDFDAMTVTYNNRVVYVRPMPISVDAVAVEQTVARMKGAKRPFARRFVEGDSEFLSLGVERTDYTKGIPERFRAIDRFFEKYPEYVGRLTHLNVLVPSRTLIKRYEELGGEIETLAENVNFKYATATWKPIQLHQGALPPSVIYKLYRGANVALVTSLADGMNLVAKEYVCAGPDDGALVLSDQAGAADELTDAIMVNPYDIEGMADAMKAAIEMSKDEKKARMRKMRASVEEHNVYAWAGKFLTDLTELKQPEPQAPAQDGKQ